MSPSNDTEIKTKRGGNNVPKYIREDCEYELAHVKKFIEVSNAVWHSPSSLKSVNVPFHLSLCLCLSLSHAHTFTYKTTYLCETVVKPEQWVSEVLLPQDINPSTGLI